MPYFNIKPYVVGIQQINLSETYHMTTTVLQFGQRYCVTKTILTLYMVTYLKIGAVPGDLVHQDRGGLPDRRVVHAADFADQRVPPDVSRLPGQGRERGTGGGRRGRRRQ